MRNIKLVAILSASFLIIITVLVLLNKVKSYRIPTMSMENTILSGSRVIALKKNFKPERFEIIIFHHPEFDTVLTPDVSMGYYAFLREAGREYLEANYEIKYTPLEERMEIISRVVGLPGDLLQLKNSELWINGQKYENEDVKKNYKIKTPETSMINPKYLKDIGINDNDIVYFDNENYILSATKNQIDKLVESINSGPAICQIDSVNQVFPDVFPHSDSIKWNRDNFGEIRIPKKGVPIIINQSNLPIYKRLIDDFEENDLKSDGNKIYINGKITDTYTPKMDYYFMISDNRHNAADSRYWGFLPENHISGKVIKIF